MHLNQSQLRLLQRLSLAEGVERFRDPLERQIFLSPDPQQRPAPDFIRRANRFRQIA